MKEIVISILSVKMVLYVDQIIVQIPLAFILNLIAVMPQLLEMNIFVQLLILVQKMKEIVILIMNAKQTFFVILQLVVQHILDLHLMWIAVSVDLDVSLNK